MFDPLIAWDRLLLLCAPAFTQPSFTLFQCLMTAWALCPGRKTVTAMISMIEPVKRRAHDAYHRLLRSAQWSLAKLWCPLTLWLIARFAKDGQIPLLLDDTLYHKCGRRVSGAGVFRDAVRSTAKHVVYARGLNLVVLCVRVTPPWTGEPLALPINVRLHHKGGPTLLDLAEEMVREVAGWLPERTFKLCCDGAYASLAGRGLDRTVVLSRMRRDAALFRRPVPPRKRRAGRPRKKGARLPLLEKIAKTTKGWKKCTIDCRGRSKELKLLALPVLWYGVCPDSEVLLVIVRDPSGKQPDDFFFTTDLQETPALVAADYASRWAIEDTFRNAKQYLGGQHPQTWKGEGPERAAGLSFWLYVAIWAWYLLVHGDRQTWEPTPWYPAKRAAAFQDALAALRRVLWRKRFSSLNVFGPQMRKTVTSLINALARAG